MHCTEGQRPEQSAVPHEHDFWFITHIVRPVTKLSLIFNNNLKNRQLLKCSEKVIPSLKHLVLLNRSLKLACT